MKKGLVVLMAFLATCVSAGYDANFTGRVTHVLTYPGSTLILIKVSGQPTSHPTCTSLDFLAIDPGISNESRQLVMSRLLMAYASGETVNIGYDKTADCVGSRIRVHRVG